MPEEFQVALMGCAISLPWGEDKQERSAAQMLVGEDDDACCAGEGARRLWPTIYAALNGAAAIAALVVLILVSDGGDDLVDRSHGAAAVVLTIGSLCMAEAIAGAAVRGGVAGVVARLRELMAVAAIGAVASSIAAAPDAVGDRGTLVASSALVFVGTAAAVVAVVWGLTVVQDAF